MVVIVERAQRRLRIGELVRVELSTRQQQREAAAISSKRPSQSPLVQIERFIQQTASPVELRGLFDNADVGWIISHQLVDEPDRGVDLAVTFEERRELQAVHHRL